MAKVYRSRVVWEDREFRMALWKIRHGIASDPKWRQKHLRTIKKKLKKKVLDRFDRGVMHTGTAFPPLARSTIVVARSKAKSGKLKGKVLGPPKRLQFKVDRDPTKRIRDNITVRGRRKGAEIVISSKYGNEHWNGIGKLPKVEFIGFSNGDINMIEKEIIKWWRRWGRRKGK